MGASFPQQFESRDAVAVVDAVSRILAPHEMDVRHPGQTIRAHVRHVQLASCRLADLTYGAAVRIRSRVPADRILVHTVIEGQSRMALSDGRTRVLDEGAMHVSMPGAPLAIAFGSSSRHMTANLPVSLWPAAAAFREEERSPMVALDDGSAGVWLDLMRFALGWGEIGSRVLQDSAGHIAALIGDFLCDRVTIEGAAGGAVPWFVVQARALMTELVRSGQEVITPGQVAAQVGVGLRTLQMGFRRFVGRSFGEDLREQRLHELHRLIAVSSGQDDVTTLMHACGIVSTGRFAGYYRERFGMLPSTQLRG
ncbi:MAG: AraC family transcriptional regulator [Novosphingobium aromaticivorans]|jgi:AraC-like DNA-binding protein|nr:AraC family transcriptional regulator [Novosphingobium aromaticivorans]